MQEIFILSERVAPSRYSGRRFGCRVTRFLSEEQMRKGSEKATPLIQKALFSVAIKTCLRMIR